MSVGSEDCPFLAGAGWLNTLLPFSLQLWLQNTRELQPFTEDSKSSKCMVIFINQHIEKVSVVKWKHIVVIGTECVTIGAHVVSMSMMCLHMRTQRSAQFYIYMYLDTCTITRLFLQAIATTCTMYILSEATNEHQTISIVSTCLFKALSHKKQALYMYIHTYIDEAIHTISI